MIYREYGKTGKKVSALGFGGMRFADAENSEACLEAMRTGAIVGIQDMGAAGLTCSTCEMASRGGAGIQGNRP